MPGTVTSGVEVTHVSRHALWLLLGNEELAVPFAQFPWFKTATIEQLSNVLPRTTISIGLTSTLTLPSNRSGIRRLSRWFLSLASDECVLALDLVQYDSTAVGSANLPADAGDLRIDYGVAGWGGVRPPAGDPPHRYVFTVHALGVEKLDLSPDATAALAGFMANENSIGKASFEAGYGTGKAK